MVYTYIFFFEIIPPRTRGMHAKETTVGSELRESDTEDPPQSGSTKVASLCTQRASGAKTYRSFLLPQLRCRHSAFHHICGCPQHRHCRGPCRNRSLHQKGTEFGQLPPRPLQSRLKSCARSENQATPAETTCLPGHRELFSTTFNLKTLSRARTRSSVCYGDDNDPNTCSGPAFFSFFGGGGLSPASCVRLGKKRSMTAQVQSKSSLHAWRL